MRQVERRGQHAVPSSTAAARHHGTFPHCHPRHPAAQNLAHRGRTETSFDNGHTPYARYQFCNRRSMIFLFLGGNVQNQNRWQCDLERSKRWSGRSWVALGAQGLRRTPTQPNATRRAENPLPGAARAAALRAKIPVKNNKETVLHVLTRLGPEAGRIFHAVQESGHMWAGATFVDCDNRGNCSSCRLS